MGQDTITIECECASCGGTGLYSGIGESPGAFVECHTCKASGKSKITYRPFKGRRDPETPVKRVYQTNPGIKIGEGNGYTLADFGGLSYKAWLAGEPFAPGTEDRQHTCPAWFYQCADESKKPEWAACRESIGMSFSRCPHFPDKDACWRRWDSEYGDGGGDQ